VLLRSDAPRALPGGLAGPFRLHACVRLRIVLEVRRDLQVDGAEAVAKKGVERKSLRAVRDPGFFPSPLQARLWPVGG